MSERLPDRLLRDGARSLSDDELVAVLLHSSCRGTSARRLAGQLLEGLGGLGALATVDEGVIDRAGKQVRFSDNLNAKLDFEQAARYAADGTCIGGLGISGLAPSSQAAHTCGLKSGGALWCWGPNDVGQMGVPQDPSFVMPPTAMSTASGRRRLRARRARRRRRRDAADEPSR